MSESPPGTGPHSGDIRSRLQAALRAAVKARDTVAASALRSALAAIANAEAIPVPETLAPPPDRSAPRPSPPAAANQYIAGSAPGLAATEAGRREVTEEEAVAIAEQEAAERQAAAGQYQATGHADRADRLLREAQAIRSALDQSG
jgi:uncharacterized protein